MIAYHSFAVNQRHFFQDAINNPNTEYEWAKHIQAKVANKEECLNIKLKLLCGADLLESFAVPNLWKDEDVK